MRVNKIGHIKNVIKNKQLKKWLKYKYFEISNIEI